MNTFIQVCKEISFPISLEKTYWGSTLLIFLGFLLDTERQIISVPVDKVEKALYLIQRMLSKKKGTVKQIQKLACFLNFLCRCIVPGQAFTRRLYALTSGCEKLKPYHHINLRQENRLDLLMWQRFLSSANVFSRDFADFSGTEAEDILMYSDASRNFQKGFGAWCNQSWTLGAWDYKFMYDNEPSIEYLELFAVTVAVKLWIHQFTNRKIYLFFVTI